ncbi:DUF4136 domain-containing protein [Sphingomonas sp. AR_OL41]|uniref:DUF4136 domain-containing protein n=1 Tax=Sphingomonas sp. AR_OL41 TaxID=3042729 RepID=UPI002480184D|nr:DUF4136 domain-containing protein [Sphingomonas sp. AR_OL41]MDH7973786.1 DUF4136 domain-containing protein [Sphingomonas sp. AR_OL41]
MRALSMVLVAGAAMSLGGCATTPTRTPVEVSRFHLGAPLETGTLSAEAATTGWATSLESQVYTGAVANELNRYGYAAPAAGTASQYLAVVGVTRTTRPGPPRRPPVTIGIGGGTSTGGYGGGVGIGGSVSFPIGKPRYREIVLTDLSVQIRRRTDGTVIWEGHAQTAADSASPDAQANVEAAKLAAAIFKDFPGESGRTITVK